MSHESMTTDDVFSVTHAEVDQVRNFLNGSISRHNEQAGLEIQGAIRAYISTVREELPDIVRVQYGQGLSEHVDLNLDDWTFFFAGAYRSVNPSDFGEFWLKHHNSFINTLERHVLVRRGYNSPSIGSLFIKHV